MGCMCEGADEHAPMGTFSSAWSWAAQRKSTAPLQRQPAFVFWMARPPALGEMSGVEWCGSVGTLVSWNGPRVDRGGGFN